MKKIFPLALFMAFVCYGKAQTSVAFCASVESSGYCYFNNTKFIAQEDSTTGKIFMQVRSESLLGTSKIVYKIFQVDKTGKETIIKTIDQSVQPDWKMAWMPYQFNSGSKYTVKIFNDADQQMCAKSFELLNWK